MEKDLVDWAFQLTKANMQKLYVPYVFENEIKEKQPVLVYFAADLLIMILNVILKTIRKKYFLVNHTQILHVIIKRDVLFIS